MKRYIILLAALLTSALCHAQNPQIEKLWEDANKAYTDANYEEAVRGYNAILEQGYTGYKLYFNLGNAYFKSNQIGKAVLFYNRALLLRPADRDAAYNLEIANAQIKDKIETIPEFFITRWIQDVRSMMGSNGWAVASLLMLALTLGAALVYLLSEKLPMRKIGFYTAICALALFVVSLSFSLIERHEALNSPDAIIMNTAASVKSSPDVASKDIFILHEGTKVKVLSSLGDWREIEIASGDKGWISSTAIERIR